METEDWSFVVINDLQSKIKRLREALEPFANMASFFAEHHQYLDEDTILWMSRHGISVSIKVKHIRKARATLAKSPAGREG